jgi:hypothetical protein
MPPNETIDSNTGEVVPPPSSAPMAQRPAPFQNHALAPTNETAITAAATQARAMVEARFALAYARPRNMEDVRIRLLNECKRTGFAETARYKRPAGKKKNDQTGKWEETFIEGPSIRFVEAALRLMGNVDIQSPTIYDDDNTRIVRVLVCDLETNTTHSRDITIEKSVEKKRLREGQKPIGQRVNSYGDMVYLVVATDSEVVTKQNAEISKSIRTLGQRLLPSDVLEETMAKCIETKLSAVTKDPDAHRKRMLDGFAELGVMPNALKAYLGQEIATCSPKQIDELRDLYLAIKDGMTTWAEVMEAANASEADGDGDGAAKSTELKDKIAQHAADAKKKKQEKEAAKAAAEQQGQQPSKTDGAQQADGANAADGAKQ